MHIAAAEGIVKSADLVLLFSYGGSIAISKG